MLNNETQHIQYRNKRFVSEQINFVSETFSVIFIDDETNNGGRRMNSEFTETFCLRIYTQRIQYIWEERHMRQQHSRTQCNNILEHNAKSTNLFIGGERVKDRPKKDQTFRPTKSNTRL